jgi:hypothetical protein
MDRKENNKWILILIAIIIVIVIVCKLSGCETVGNTYINPTNWVEAITGL